MSDQGTIDFSAIDWIICDVDGVLTDGTILLGADGSEQKLFHLQDGHGIRLWRRAGGDVALLSGRGSPATLRRAEQLNIKHVFQDCHTKLPVLQTFLTTQGIAPERLSAHGFGMERPVADNNTAQGRKSNRRVEIIIRDGT